MVISFRRSVDISTIPQTADKAGNPGVYSTRQPDKIDTSVIANIYDTKKGKIQVGTNNYSVKVVDGKASLKIIGLLNKIKMIFSSRSRHEYHDLKGGVREGILSLNKARVEYNNTKNISNENIAKHLHNSKIINVSTVDRKDLVSTVGYGFSNIRNVVGSDHVKLSTIDELNMSLDLIYSRDISNFTTLFDFDRLEKQEVKKEFWLGGMRELTPDQASDAGKWKDFLVDRIKDGTANLDAFERMSKIADYLQNGGSEKLSDMQRLRADALGLDGIIGEWIEKNSQNFQEMQGLSLPERRELSSNCIALCKELIALPSTKERIEYLDAQFGKMNPVPTHVDIVLDSMCCHFFRQTSKMGIDFFGTQDKKISFWFQAPKQDPNTGLTTIKTFSDLTKDNQQQRRQGYNEAITFSEMRHVIRLMAANKAQHVHLVTNE